MDQYPVKILSNKIIRNKDIKIMNTRPIGLHIRLHNGLRDVIAAAQKFNISVAQSFLMNESSKYVSCSAAVKREFVHLKKDLGFSYFVHAAYWSSLINVKSKEFISLCKETEIALDLESNGIVVHVGATKTHLQKQDQAQYVAQGLNELFEKIPDIPILLENGPHAGRNFGGDFTDFMLLKNLVEQRHRVQFCIDTAHAYVYGYNIANPMARKEFFALLQEVFADETIALLHVNDTTHHCASQIDQHGIPGEGFLGESTLQQCMQYSLLKDVPIVLELPGSCNDQDMQVLLQRVRSWDK